MSPTFNIELWQQLKRDFLDGNVFFGQAPEDTPAPYCVMFSLDSGDDENSKTLCGYTSGESELQFNLYDFNDMAIDEKLEELCSLLKSYSSFEVYSIIGRKRGTVKMASSFSSEVGAGLARYTFKYQTL